MKFVLNGLTPTQSINITCKVYLKRLFSPFLRFFNFFSVWFSGVNKCLYFFAIIIFVISVQGMTMAPGQQTITQYLNGNSKETAAIPAVNGKSAENDKPVDEESKKGRFAWFELEKTYLPYIFR